VKVRAALGLRDLLALEAMGPYAPPLARLLPDKAELLMREAEAVGALGLALALGESLQANGRAVAEAVLRIRERRSGPSAGEALLTLARDALGDAYQDLRLAGVGPSSFVVTAVPRDAEDRVAIKFLGPGAYMDERSRARFEREANLLKQLDNPHILKIFSYHAQDPPHMVGIKLCDALQAAHDAGIIHRDVEPGNILIDGNGVKLIDFGLARTKQWEVSAQGSLLGDWAYMAPEQYTATIERPSILLDVFGLAAVLHHMLTGEPPYARFNMIIRERNQALQDMRDELPDALVQLILEGLAENPQVRPQTIGDFAEGLRQIYLRGGKE
jgi:serine/threonine-protein kinase